MRLGADRLGDGFAVAARVAIAELVPAHGVGHALRFEKFDGWSQRLVLILTFECIRGRSPFIRCAELLRSRPISSD